jgi:hypothetical protein
MPSYSSMVPAVVLLLAAGASASAQSPGDPGAAANVRQSEQYEQALRTNPGFRAQRMKLECGPINDPELRQQCIASFGGDGGPPSARKRQQN